MVKKARVTQKATKAGKLNRRRVTKAAKEAVSAKGLRSENADRNRAIKSAVKDFKLSMKEVMKRFMAEAMV